MIDPSPNRASPSDVFPILAKIFSVKESDVSLYARYLREFGKKYKADLWPSLSRVRGPKYELNSAHIALLLTAMSASRTANDCGRNAFAYVFLRQIGNQPLSFGYALQVMIDEKEILLNIVVWETPPWI